ncbi:MAG: glycoside hydrolase family 9 protein [Verrucomicrobia bacterium]|nr:glycoside hydrolase family 9 protein [Verrucomicrobiota bacterium]
MYTKNNKTNLANLFRTLVFGIFLVVLSVTGANAKPHLRITDANPMAMPPVGAYGLRILTPKILELTLITTKPKDGAVTAWNFVSNGALSAPSPSEFQVTVGDQTIAVKTVGFKRRPLYAPLNQRDLRIDNKIYLHLSSAVPEGQIVTVKNASRRVFGAGKEYISRANPFRFNPAIHVSQEGYLQSHTKKAMVGYYLGSLGELNIPAGNGFRIVRVSDGGVVYTGALRLRKDNGYTYSPAPYQKVYEADFSAFQTPGEYRLQIPGMGASYAFMINDGVAGTFARSYALGLYHQRCGHSNSYPHSRHQKGICHHKPVLVPDSSFSSVNNTLASVTGDFANSQSGAPQLKNVNSSLYPFINKTAFDALGGHHDAGDYSRYTINVAQLAHSLMFAVDSFAGVADLDNLGLPESGDGISDVMQTAKWELDFLAKLQDADGGFYFLVYPKDRRYEADVSLTGTDLGDQQVVFPKTTASTAASVAALAQAASSPRFKATYPNEAAAYLAKAKKGWQFLENAWAKYGRDGAYQKITHYGNEFRDRDEIAWAACEMFLATGEAKYHDELTSRFNPADPNTRRWTWWRLFESYGCAIRSYAFAARSGRLPASALKPGYLGKCEAEIIAAGDDQLSYMKDSAYANPFPTRNKAYRSSGWFMSVEQTYDVVTAYQLVPKRGYINTLIGAMNYEAGCNPLNMGFLTGVGWKRQRETVNQYANNDRRVLPPSGIPIGSVWPGAPNIYQYGTELNSLVFPTDSTSANNMFAPYEKWTDTFHVATEMVNPQQGRGLGATAWLMAQTHLKNQPWKAATATIVGLPSSTSVNQNITVGLTADGVDLSEATIVWECRDQEPNSGATFTFAPKKTGAQWVEAEALLPDGRRVFAKAAFNAH